jgi:hypothetical protein
MSNLVLGDIQELRYKLRSTIMRSPLVWCRHLGLGNPRDVFLASYQRSGSTWLRFLLCEALAKQAADFSNVKCLIPDVREYRRGPLLLNGGRLIKTHEPYRREYKKAIYVVRDPRDVAISLYEFDRPGRDFDNFVRSFVRGKASPHGTWHRNVGSWLSSPLAENGNLLVIKYEALRLDTQGTLALILRFLGVTADKEAVCSAVANNDLQRMRAKEDRARASGVEVSGESIRSKGRGVRKGSIGEWHERLTQNQARLIEDHAGDLLASLGYPECYTSLSDQSNTLLTDNCGETVRASSAS